MATGVFSCDLVALGNVAADFVVKQLPPARSKALQRGGSHPTFIFSIIEKRQSI